MLKTFMKGFIEGFKVVCILAAFILCVVIIVYALVWLAVTFGAIIFLITILLLSCIGCGIANVIIVKKKERKRR